MNESPNRGKHRSAVPGLNVQMTHMCTPYTATHVNNMYSFHSNTCKQHVQLSQH